MGSRHKAGYLGWHPPGDLPERARQEAARQGVKLSAVLTAALSAFLDSPRKVDTTASPPMGRPPKVATTESGNTTAPAKTARSRKARAPEAAKRPRERKPKAPVTPLERVGAVLGEQREQLRAECGHTYPTVKYVMGKRVCSECPG